LHGSLPRSRRPESHRAATARPECDPPRGELPFRFRALQPLPLPFGVICVLNLEGKKARLPASGESGVVLGQFVDEKSERPSVGHDVVHRDDQNLAARRDTEQKNAYQRAPPEVERLPSRLHRARVGFLLGATRNVQRGPKHGMNGLNELALVQIERCAKGFVAVDDVVQSKLERGAVQFPLEVQAETEVVRRVAAGHLVDIPHARLCGGHWPNLPQARTAVRAHGPYDPVHDQESSSRDLCNA